MNLICRGAVLLGLCLGLGTQGVLAGSLYEEGRFRSLTADRKGHAVGDLVTVMIFENASASTSADTNAGHDAGVSANLRTPLRDRSAGVSLNNDFEGRGSTQRSGRVLGQLTVAIREVLPNGDLMLVGTQELEINNERQTIRLEGRVRPQDITENNTVLSTRIAEARIGFAGDGVLADHQKPGWWQRLLTLFGI
jgi:flagellar L-ring protein precursor FlgH